MGGGDSLFDKIDKGIRGCKVVVSCVTTKYTVSANCRREVSLADALKKPIVPLRLEAGMMWPPEGPMSMILTQLLYIDFSQTSGLAHDTWNCPQMEDLDQMLRAQVVTKKAGQQSECLAAPLSVSQPQSRACGAKTSSQKEHQGASQTTQSNATVSQQPQPGESGSTSTVQQRIQEYQKHLSQQQCLKRDATKK